MLLQEVDDLPPMYTYDLKSKEPAWWMRGNRWKVRLKKTMRILEVKRKPTYNYDAHFPMSVNKTKWKQVFGMFPWERSIGYCMNTLFFNHALDKHVHFDNCKYSCETPLGHINALAAKVRGKTYLGYNDRGLNDVLKQFIENKFKEKCRFEEGYKEPKIKEPEEPKREIVQVKKNHQYYKVYKDNGELIAGPKKSDGRYKGIPLVNQSEIENPVNVE